MERVNYNQISNVYNSRYEQNPLNGIRKYLYDFVSKNKPKNILEVGCGTGHWLETLSGSSSFLFGLDYSRGMLNKANHSLTGVSFINADANTLPIKKNSIDFVYVINAIHQFQNPFVFIKKSIDILTKGGSLTIIGIEIAESIGTWYIFDYFKRTMEIDLKRFPSFNDLNNSMKINGFEGISQSLIEKVNTSKNADEILNDHFLDKRGASQLALLSDDEYKTGINNIKKDIKTAKKENREIKFVTKLNFYSLSGRKP